MHVTLSNHCPHPFPETTPTNFLSLVRSILDDKVRNVFLYFLDQLSWCETDCLNVVRPTAILEPFSRRF